MRVKILFVSVVCVAVAAWTAIAQGKATLVRASLEGFSEVPAVSTTASGQFRGTIDAGNSSLEYELQYSGLQGTVTQSHIHLGVRSTNGGIMIWLCGTDTNPGPSGTPTCPQEGAVNRTVVASDVVGPAGQGVSAGEFAEAMAALRAGAAYANVHSSMFGGGEIRGQVRPVRRQGGEGRGPAQGK